MRLFLLLRNVLMDMLKNNNDTMKMLLELRKLGIIDHKILSAITNYKREEFLPKRLKGLSEEDISLQIFDGVETTSLSDLAKMIFLVLQNNKRTNLALEIGTASGMLTAVLSAIYNRVYSIEINKEAYDFSSSILKSYSSKILLKLGDGKKGWKEVAPFDAIYIDSCVTDNIVEFLKDQLNENGILVFAKKYLDKQFYCLEGKKSNTLLYKSVFQVNRTMLI